MGSVKGNIYGILSKPRITEKSANLGAAANVVVFDVHPRANKKEIREAVEKIFEVKVRGVRTIRTFGKGKKPGIRGGGRNDYKKAYVSLAEGSTIDVIEGL